MNYFDSDKYGKLIHEAHNEFDREMARLGREFYKEVILPLCGKYELIFVRVNDVCFFRDLLAKKAINRSDVERYQLSKIYKWGAPTFSDTMYDELEKAFSVLHREVFDGQYFCSFCPSTEIAVLMKL